MLQNLFYAISGTFYTLLNNTDLYLSYFILSYVFLEHNDSVEWGLTVVINSVLWQNTVIWGTTNYGQIQRNSLQQPQNLPNFAILMAIL